MQEHEHPMTPSALWSFPLGKGSSFFFFFLFSSPSLSLLGTREWFVIHHTDCGMLLFNDDVMSDLLKEGVYTATYPNLTGGKGPSSNEGKFIKWHTFKDLSASVVEDVHRIASHVLVPADIKIYG
jgi:carbonic anhydrase